jgi:folate-binding protein YgfZ
MRQGRRGKHGFAEIGGGEEKDRSHALVKGAGRVNVKSTSQSAGVACAFGAAQVVAMPRLERLDRTLIRVSGPDTNSFLNNLLTQDIWQGSVQYGALLSPQGKVSADMFVWSDDGGAVIDCAPSRGADLMRRLTMYKLRAQVELRDVSADFAVVVGDDIFEGANGEPRLAALGWRKVVPAGEAYTSADWYESRRLVLGVPDLARDAAPDEVFAGEALLDELNGVDFGKGCFVGQENVSRMKRRATTRKKFCPVAYEGEMIAYGTPVLADEAEIGSVRTGAPGRSLALLRLDRALEAVAAGKKLSAAGREIRLDPPSWLILPQREDAAG